MKWCWTLTVLLGLGLIPAVSHAGDRYDDEDCRPVRRCDDYGYRTEYSRPVVYRRTEHVTKTVRRNGCIVRRSTYTKVVEVRRSTSVTYGTYERPAYRRCPEPVRYRREREDYCPPRRRVYIEDTTPPCSEPDYSYYRDCVR